ncbi:CocE/NonD family hydrolase C-terminal non-catalytic domain-containing protein [Streptomyces sp. 150FB]|uniref:CocE/NonD family hydrolase C-terminal non-catalytic domain-containing protein n=1 Tax=Streptomyces sp. 150FB TaxID=1576605 RepID=UPI001F3561F7|nr:CocE/NonD family hydrolase C-terminal non-catalytic domain-containing protein [Streptomyces sp. 150FB]
MIRTTRTGRTPARPGRRRTNLGNWRAEKSWPTANRSANLCLGKGSYVDSEAGSQPTPPEQDAGRDAASFIVWSGTLETATRVTGAPRVTMTAKGEGNVMVKLYDVGADGNAVAFDERVSRLDRDRPDIGLKSTDWTLRPATFSVPQARARR